MGHDFTYSQFYKPFPVSMTAGTTYGGTWDGWYGPSGREQTTGHRYDLNEVMASLAGRAVSRVGIPLTSSNIETLRKEAEVMCDSPSKSAHSARSECKPLVAPCLFNVKNDPCEQNNLANT